MRVLVVDDNADVRDVLTCGLQYLGRCDPAENGLAAVEMFKEACRAGEPYGMVTMDCQMPVLDGFDAVCRIRGFEAGLPGNWFRTTICFITAEDQCLQRYEQQYGRDDALFSLPKPFRFLDLGKIAQLALSRVRTAQPQVQLLPRPDGCSRIRLLSVQRDTAHRAGLAV
jgi:CheY-like chemotaxis protein